MHLQKCLTFGGHIHALSLFSRITSIIVSQKNRDVKRFQAKVHKFFDFYKSVLFISYSLPIEIGCRTCYTIDKKGESQWADKTKHQAEAPTANAVQLTEAYDKNSEKNQWADKPSFPVGQRHADEVSGEDRERPQTASKEEPAPPVNIDRASKRHRPRSKHHFPFENTSGKGNSPYRMMSVPVMQDRSKGDCESEE